MKVRILILSVIALSAVLCGSCRKNCRCYGYDGDVTDYSRDEVKARDNSCSGMEMQGGTRFYSICEWDN